MANRKIDDSIRQALLDAIKLDLENQDSASHEFAPPSAHHQREMAEMLRDPNAWAAKRLQELAAVDPDKS